MKGCWVAAGALKFVGGNDFGMGSGCVDSLWHSVVPVVVPPNLLRLQNALNFAMKRTLL